MDNPVVAQTHHAQPILSPAEAWMAGKATGLEIAAQLVREAMAEWPDGAVTPEAERSLMNALDTLRGESDSAWRHYLDHAGLAGAPKRSELAELFAEFDTAQELPMLFWPIDTSAKEDAWGVEDLPMGDGTSITLTMPFRPVVLKKLPENTHTFALRDPRHAATAALVEALETVRRDTNNALIAPTLTQGWRRILKVVANYRQTAKIAIRHIRDDEYLHWRPAPLHRIDLQSAPGMICQVAASARAQQCLTLHVVGAWMQALLDQIESEVAEDSRAERLRDAIASAGEHQQRTLETMNLAVLRQNGVDEAQHRLMVAFRPIPDGIPMLLAIPVSAPSTVSTLPRAVAL